MSAAFLAKHAGGGTALEFAIGTGRVALPLTQHGVRVDGIELSTHMVARLREKAGGDGLDVVVGDMTSDTTGKTYPPGTRPTESRFTTPAKLYIAQGQFQRALEEAQRVQRNRRRMEGARQERRLRTQIRRGGRGVTQGVKLIGGRLSESWRSKKDD